MKKLILFSFLFIFINFTGLLAQPIASNDGTAIAETVKTTISWDKTTFDFGEITQNIPAEAKFKLTNNGNEPFIVTDVKKTCGCTATGYSQEPILPGESTIITATYNAKKEGKFTKTIKVSTSLSSEFIPLKLKGTVVKAEK